MSKQFLAVGAQEDLLPFITVVVPVLNEERFIQQTLEQLVAQDYPAARLEILVVDGGSSDLTREKVEQFVALSPVRVELLDNPRRLSSSARNIGARKAAGDYVLFVDGHVYIPNNQVLLSMGRTARDYNAMVLARPQPLTPPGLNRTQEAIAAVRASRLGHSGESYIYSQFEGWVSPLSVGVMYHRSLFQTYGMFDQAFDAAEDLEFNYRLERAGLEAYISPAFTIHYYPRENLNGLFRQMSRYGLGRINFGRKHPERLRPETFIPCISSLGLLTLLALPLVFGELLPVVGGLILFSILIIMTATFRHTRNSKLSSLFLAPACLYVIHFGLAWGVLKGLFSQTPLYLEDMEAAVDAGQEQ